jgi:hypothetical protein
MHDEKEQPTTPKATPVRDSVAATRALVRDVILRRDRHVLDRELERRRCLPSGQAGRGTARRLDHSRTHGAARDPA